MLLFKKESINSVKSQLDKLETRLCEFPSKKHWKINQIKKLKKILIKINENESHLDSIEEKQFHKGIEQIQQYMKKIYQEIKIIEDRRLLELDTKQTQEEIKKFNRFISELKQLLKNQSSFSSKVISLSKSGLTFALIAKALLGTTTYAHTNNINNQNILSANQDSSQIEYREDIIYSFLEKLVCIQEGNNESLRFFCPPLLIPDNQEWFMYIVDNNNSLIDKIQIKSSQNFSQYWFGRQNDIIIGLVEFVGFQNGKKAFSELIEINKSKSNISKSSNQINKQVNIKAKEFPEWPKNLLFTWDSPEHIKIHAYFSKELEKIDKDYKNANEYDKQMFVDEFIEYMKKIIEFYVKVGETKPVVSSIFLASEFQISKENISNYLSNLTLYAANIGNNLYDIDKFTTPKEIIKAAENTMLQQNSKISEIFENYNFQKAVIELMKEIPIDAKDWLIRMNNIAPTFGGLSLFSRLGPDIKNQFEKLQTERKSLGLPIE